MRFSLPMVAVLCVGGLTGCAAVQETPPGVNPPRVAVATLEVPPIEATTMSQMSVVVRVAVTNTDENDIVVNRLQVESIGVGPYEVAPAEMRFNRTIGTKDTELFEVHSSARAMTPTERPGGQEGRVRIRVIGYFGSLAGQFRVIVLESVGTTYGQAEEAPRPRD